MRYLVCEKCGGYYELKPGEYIADFIGCECGGKFKYSKNIDEIKNNDKPTEMNKIKDQNSINPQSTVTNIDEYCANCGSQNKKEAVFCKNCGIPKNQTNQRISYQNSILARIEWKNALFGSIIGFVISTILILGIGTLYKFLDVTFFSFFFMLLLTGSFYSSYTIFGDSKKQIINGLTAGVISSTLIAALYFMLSISSLFIYSDTVLSFGFIIILLGIVFGSIGGLIGIGISKLSKNKTSKIIGILLTLILASSMLTMVYGIQIALDSQPKYFENSHVSFSYPGSWKEMQTDMPELGFTEVAKVSNKDIGGGVFVYKYDMFISSSSSRNFIDKFFDLHANNTSSRIISSRNIKLNGVPAYEIVSEEIIDGTNVKSRALWFDENSELYLLVLVAPSNKFDQEQNNFNLILNTFEIK
ncbi:MAG: PsbP-related protein [Methanobacteriaceae archaeon]|jgi:hypothetical protein|nr:PsbP-related protein [Methanobacteriaceae archaeon]